MAPRMAAFRLGRCCSEAWAVYLAVQGDDLMPPTPEWFPWFVAMNWATAVALLLSLLAVFCGDSGLVAGRSAPDHKIKFRWLGLPA